MLDEERGRGRDARPARRWVVPPVVGTVDEPFEGYAVLDELRGDLGVLLWQIARAAALWAGVGETERARLFAAGARERVRSWIVDQDCAAELEPQLAVLLRVYDGAGPVPGELGAACHAVARWADAQSLPHTALAFARSAALLAPASPDPAWEVGNRARLAGSHRYADTWFRRSLGLARRSRSWKFYALACIGLGNLSAERGDRDAAQTWYVRALRVARRSGLWTVRATALHDLFSLAAGAGDVLGAEAYAGRALRAYGRGHRRIARLAYDVARFWLDQRHYARALHVFQAVLPHVAAPAEQRVLLGRLARAAAGVGDRRTFAFAWGETWRLVDEGEDAAFVAEALNDLASGAMAFRDAERVMMAARHALTVADVRDEPKQRARAETLLEEVRRPRLEPFPPPAPLLPESRAEALANALVTALAGSAGGVG